MALARSGDIDQRLEKSRREAEERDAKRRAEAAGLPYLDLPPYPVQIEALELVPEETARAFLLAPITRGAKKVAVGVYDPRLPGTAKTLEELRRKNITVEEFVVSRAGLAHAWSFYRLVAAHHAEITGQVSISATSITKLAATLTSREAIGKAIAAFDLAHSTVTDLVEIILAGAFSLRASDIHLEAEHGHAKLRLRVDGLLHDIADVKDKDLYTSLIARVKLLSCLKLNVRDKAQDGRFTIMFEKKGEIEVRVSLIPAEFGETAVLRILDPTMVSLTLADLGFRDSDVTLIEQELAKPNGLILNTGPTGSGKTTTLYALLKKRQTRETKSITIEDPIEYHLEGIEQTQVDEEAGYTFANGLRSILRQDPDVILVGEIRDFETAEIAMHASLTGHLVFSTLHTNDAVGAIPRLVDLGVKPSVIGPALNVVIAQRLVRRLCPDCRVQQPMTPKEKAAVEAFLARMEKKNIQLPQKGEYVWYAAKGCAQCDGMGYKGRVAVAEFLRVTEEVQEMILKEVSEVSLKKAAAAQGMVTMQEDGIIKALSGTTTIEEVEGVTGLIVWGK